MSMSAPNGLCKEAQELLNASPIGALRKLRVEKTGSAIVLSGRVESFYEKQMAQELLRSIARQCDFVNSVHVGAK